jgi:hypothetical protein
MKRLSVLCVALLTWGAPAAGGFAAGLADTCASFAGYDQNGDGRAEIRALRPLASRGKAGPRALVLVESRLLNPLERAADLEVRLERLLEDLAHEGFRAEAVSVTLEPGAVHQDGAYLLALREFLRAASRDADLAGVMLVGHFPDALLVRTCNWRKQGDVKLSQAGSSSKTFKGVPYLRRVPEIIAHRADIVLSDLNGRWEKVYVQPPTRLERIVAVFAEPIPEHGGTCQAIERGWITEQDFFHIADGEIQVIEGPAGGGEVVKPKVVLDDEAGDHECGEEDLRRPNRMARPDILVSRLDARGSAWRPKESVVGADGRHLLDGRGRPQSVRFSLKDEVPNWRDGLWEPDAVLERRLLAEYLDRNHAYRTGQATVAWRVSSIACDLRSGYQTMRRAADDWAEGDPRLADVAGRPTLEDFAEWIRYPAVLRTLRAHSNPESSVFKRSDTAKLDAAVGGPAWSWTARGDRLEPSLEAACGRGRLNWFLLRTLWENGTIAPGPAFYLHTGCEGISPPGARKLPYDHPLYGARQGAEALLLFGNGLALAGRAKVFYDEPRGFAEALRGGRSFGEAWAGYFDVESQRPTGGTIGRKKAYFWSLLGDWSLKLLKPAAIASNHLTLPASVKPTATTLAPREMRKE